MSIKIIGTGKALPRFVLSNQRLSEMLDTSDEWIVTRTGIKNRHICTEETIEDLAAKAANNALENAGIKAGDIDMIIVSTVGGGTLTPSLSCMVQKMIGAWCPAFDINAACTGFIYALSCAKAYFDSNMARRILIVSAEMMSKYVDWNDRSTCVLFGDGAGAVLLEKGENLLEIKITASGNNEILTIGGKTDNNPFNLNKNDGSFLYMNGSEVFKFAVSSMCSDIEDIMQKSGLNFSQIKRVIPHQANIRIIKLAAEKLGIEDEKIISNIDSCGNTSSASIPILLAESLEKKELQSGDLIVLSAFGGGLTSGACIIKI
jgi:3-oxoacyl-[acyl-carrier-protein] synthase-3